MSRHDDSSTEATQIVDMSIALAETQVRRVREQTSVGRRLTELQRVQRELERAEQLLSDPVGYAINRLRSMSGWCINRESVNSLGWDAAVIVTAAQL